MLSVVLALLDEALCHLTRQHWDVCYRYCHDSFPFCLIKAAMLRNLGLTRLYFV
jgi:hypothetical protein